MSSPKTKRPVSKGFWAFLALTITVIGFAVFDVVSEKKSEEAKLEKSLILNWKAEQIDEISWVEGSEKMKLVRSTEGWKFVEPLQEKADSEAVSTFIEGLVLEKSNSIVTEGPSVNLQTFGLDVPQAKIKVHKNSGEEVEFLISAKKNFSGDTYLKVGSENKVTLVSSTWQQKAEKKVLDFRDRRWARLSPADVEKLEFKKGKTNFVLNKGDKDWALKSDASIQLDQNKVRKLLTDLTSHQVTGFGMKADSAPYAQLILTLKDGKKWTGEFSITKDKKHLLAVNELSQTMELNTQNADDIYKLEVDSLRDRSEPFQVRRDDIKKVIVQLGSQKWTISATGSQQDSKPGSRWTLSQDSSGTTLNEGLLTSLLGKISNLQVAEFLTPSRSLPAKSTKAHAQDQMTLFSGDGKVLLDLELKGPMPHNVNGLEKSVYFVKSSLVPYTFTMNETEWTGLDWKAVFSTAPAPDDKKPEAQSDNKRTDKK